MVSGTGQTQANLYPLPTLTHGLWVFHGLLMSPVWSSIFPFLGVTDTAKCWLELRVELFQAMLELESLYELK